MSITTSRSRDKLSQDHSPPRGISNISTKQAGGDFAWAATRLIIIPILGILLVTTFINGISLIRKTPTTIKHASMDISSAQLHFTSEKILTATKYKLVHIPTSTPISFKQAMHFLEQSDPSFTDLLISTLKSHASRAFFWECISVTSATIHTTQFEFVILPAKGLMDLLPDQESFASQFIRGIDGIASFASLSGDAMLVAPCPLEGVRTTVYVHIASFMRLAPREQAVKLLSTMAARVLHQVDKSTGRLWLSTSGLGISWLHIRLDSRPKYYNWIEYASV